MPSEWKEQTLGDLLTIKHGFAFKGEHFTDKKEKTIAVTPGNFAIDGGFQNPKPKYYCGPVPRDYVLDPGQIIVTMTDLSKQSDTLGYAAKVPDDDNTWLHNQRIGLVEIKAPEETDAMFIHYLMRTYKYRSWVVGSATGTTVKHTSPIRILVYSCPIPKKRTQQRIASILGSLDDKIELNRKMNETLEEMAKALFKSWFVDFDPVIDNAIEAGNPVPEQFAQRAEVRRQALANGTANRQTAQQFPAAFQLTEEMGWIPEGWGTQSLHSSSQFINGAAFKNEMFSDSEGALPVIKIAELKNGITQQTKFTKAIMADKYKIDTGEMLLSWSGNPDTSIDTFIWQDGKAWLNQHIFRVAPFDNVDSHFIFYLLKYCRPVLAEIARDKQTTGLGHFTIKDMKRLKVISPPLSFLEKFNFLVGPVFTRWFKSRTESDLLSTLRDTLLPKLISGELRIPDAEKLIEEAGV